MNNYEKLVCGYIINDGMTKEAGFFGVARQAGGKILKPVGNFFGKMFKRAPKATSGIKREIVDGALMRADEVIPAGARNAVKGLPHFKAPPPPNFTTTAGPNPFPVMSLRSTPDAGKLLRRRLALGIGGAAGTYGGIAGVSGYLGGQDALNAAPGIINDASNVMASGSRLGMLFNPQGELSRMAQAIAERNMQQGKGFNVFNPFSARRAVRKNLINENVAQAANALQAYGLQGVPLSARLAYAFNPQKTVETLRSQFLG